MGSLRFNYTVRAVVSSSTAANFRPHTCMSGKLVAFELPADGLCGMSSDLLFRMTKYGSRSGLRLLSTRVKSPKAPPGSASR